MNLDKALRDIRKQRGLTQVQLAKKVGCADSAIRHYESGRRVPNKEMLAKIAAALEVASESLVGYGIESSRGFLAAIFDCEDSLGLMPVESGDGLAIGVDHKAPGSPKVQNALKAWQAQRDALAAGEITEDEYRLWKSSFGA